jgi:exodeoxyribonuclease VII small subunit
MPKNKTTSFEDAFDELDKTVEQLEAGDIPLEESISLYERGMTLAAELEKQLEQAELRVRKLRPSNVSLDGGDDLETGDEDEGEDTE